MVAGNDDPQVNGFLAVTDGVGAGVVAQLRGVTVPQRIEDVSITVGAGETVAFVGRSGAGKSTAMRVMMGAVLPAEGEVQVARNFAYVPQDISASMNPRLSVADVIAEPLAIRGGASAARAASSRISKVVEDLGLPRGVLRRRPQELSGGQRQRVGIARALVVEPEVVFADEALSALDVATRDVAMGLFADQDAALVLITHDLEAVAEMCHRWVFFESGRVVEEGPADSLCVRSAGMSAARARLLDAECALGRGERRGGVV